MNEDENWKPVIFDDISVLYLRLDRQNDEIISSYGLDSINPCQGKKGYHLPKSNDVEGLKEARAELQGIIDYYKDAGLLSKKVSSPYRFKGLIEMRLGGDYLNDAVESLSKAVKIDDNAMVFYDLGVAFRKLGDSEKAVEHFTAASKGFDKGYLGMG
nr:tetratricopeptide repeat protein [Candidatus Bathyarchaeota archaeon]NIW34969.1 hypothetical protein [Candidatus Bathyarchaeota archaeon]